MFWLKLRALVVSGRARLRKSGVSGILAYGSRRAFRAIVFRKDVLVVYVRDAGAADGALSDAQELRWLDAHALARLQAEYPDFLTALRMRAYQDRLARSERCYGLFGGEGLLSLGWVGLRSSIRAEPEVGSRFTLELEGEFPVIYNCWTPPDRRGLGHYESALRRIAAALLVDYRQVWIYSLQANRQSSRGIRSAGFEPRLTYVRSRLLGIERHSTHASR